MCKEKNHHMNPCCFKTNWGSRFILNLIAIVFFAPVTFSQIPNDQNAKYGEVVKGKYFEGLIVYYRPTELDKKTRRTTRMVTNS